MARSIWRTGASGLLAGFVFSMLSGLTFYDIGVRSGILFNPAYQNAKVLAVVPTMVMAKAPYVIFAGWTIILTGYAFLFARICVFWPRGYWRRLWRLGLLIWFFSLLFFEFQGPYNLLREPIPLLLLELLFLDGVRIWSGSGDCWFEQRTEEDHSSRRERRSSPPMTL